MICSFSCPVSSWNHRRNEKGNTANPWQEFMLFFFKITSWLGQTSLQKGRLDYRVSVPGTWCWNQVISASFVHLIWLQGKTRILTCWSKEKEKRKIFGTKCSSSSAPPCPQHAVGLKGAESLLSPTLTGPPASEPSDTGSMRPTLNSALPPLSNCGFSYSLRRGIASFWRKAYFRL